MGGVVKAITKPFKSIISSTVGSLLGDKAAPQIVQVPQQQQAAVQVQEAPTVKPEVDTGEGTSTESAARRGKKGLTVRRTNMGGGSGLNL